MTRRREVYYVDHEGDFGLTGLAEALSSPAGPRLDAPAVLALAARTANDDEDHQLGKDVRLLLESPLPGEVLRTVWLAAVGGRFDPVDHGTDTRSWLREIVAVCPVRESQWTGEEPVVPEAEVRESVLSEITTASPALTSAAQERDVVSALGQVVAEADADLGFRLFLRALKAYGVTVPEDQYHRLLAIGERLAYPLAAVFGGLDVSWPPLDPGRRDFEFGFGLPGLSRLFDGEWDSWRHEGTGTPREHVARLTHADSGMTPGAQAAVLLEDVTRLLDSELSEEAITALWRTAARRRRAVDAFDADGRTWLREIADVCTQRLTVADPAYEPFVSPPRTDLMEPVAREVQHLGQAVSRETGTDGTAATLEHIVTTVDADLGFRFLVRIVEAYRISLTAACYARFRELGERLGQHPSQVTDAVEES
ncbi:MULTISPECIES: hypothetical protein [Streptomyces]|uniref:hypothetical protein n=1 Tax=Streptomyces TaxID=1883 RepID=UPI001F3292C7|nr:hypothetical protein [Streptomyces sp. FB2]MCF2540633.1 hypothetical protein [Streptomyces sp. FB2]